MTEPPSTTKLHHDPAMSASQIPNLNTLRRGAGRGRLRGRGGHEGSGPGSRSGSQKDRVVQGTDNDASVSRLSAVGLGYLEDPFARALTPPGQETRRLPIINRGNSPTYYPFGMRLLVCTDAVESFCAE